MNNVHFYRLKRGKVETQIVRVGQGGVAWMDQDGQRDADGKLPRDHTPRRMTVKEAEDMMIAKGWSRKKPKLPAAIEAAA